jgi:type I restriction enzyme S subunit
LPPLAEQERIVEAIEEHLSRLDAADEQLCSASRRVAAFERSVFARAQADGDEVPLGELLVGIETGKSFKTPGRQARNGEWGVIKVSAMTWGSFDEAENKAVPTDQVVDPRDEIRPGDLLLSRANTSEYVGATVLVGATRPRLVLSDKSMRLLTIEGVDRRWLRFALGSPRVRSQMSQLASGTSDSMRNISQAKVRSLRVRVPALELQMEQAIEIEECLEKGGRLAGGLKVARTGATALRAAVLGAAFSGHLVPQNANEEPASALLERIRAKRQAAPSRPRRTGS